MLKLWRARNLSLEGEITVFKALALSKITDMALVKIIPPSIIDQLNKTHTNFICNSVNPKIKNLAINNNYKNGLQRSCIKRLFNETFHDWKILPTHIIHKPLVNKFVFHSNLQINRKLTKNLSKYYRDIINTWGSKLSCQNCYTCNFISAFTV